MSEGFEPIPETPQRERRPDRVHALEELRELERIIVRTSERYAESIGAFAAEFRQHMSVFGRGESVDWEHGSVAADAPGMVPDGTHGGAGHVAEPFGADGNGSSSSSFRIRGDVRPGAVDDDKVPRMSRRWTRRTGRRHLC